MGARPLGSQKGAATYLPACLQCMQKWLEPSLMKSTSMRCNTTGACTPFCIKVEIGLVSFYQLFAFARRNVCKHSLVLQKAQIFTQTFFRTLELVHVPWKVSSSDLQWISLPVACFTGQVPRFATVSNYVNHFNAFTRSVMYLFCIISYSWQNFQFSVVGLQLMNMLRICLSILYQNTLYFDSF